MDLDTQLTVPPQVISRLVGDETVLLDLASGMYFGVDGVAMHIWESIAAGQTLNQAVAAVVADFDVDKAQAEADALEFVNELVERGLLAV